MTEPNDTTSTRPISVAELLAKNGSIGAPSPGGRRRRRRGNADAVTVAELTGEIPILTLRTDEHEAIDAEQDAIDADIAARAQSVLEQPQVTPDEDEAPAPTETVESTETADTLETAEPVETPDESDDEAPEAAAEADYEAHVQQRDGDFAPLAFDPRARRHHGLRRSSAMPAGGAEEMSPDPLLDDDDLASGTAEDAEATASLPSYLRSSGGTLFGGDTVADDLARRTRTPGPEDISLDPDAVVEPAEQSLEDLEREPEPPARSPLLHGVWIVAQSIFAVAFGAGLFVAFDQLWKWNNIVALVLSVLVILGLVVGVRVVRRTEDIASTLIAVAVGALVTLGPLALLQST
ncbi:FUSC family protein [Mycobacterium sp. BMJ-28]